MCLYWECDKVIQVRCVISWFSAFPFAFDTISAILAVQTAIRPATVCIQSSISVEASLNYTALGTWFSNWMKAMQANKDTMNTNKIYEGCIVKIRNVKHWLWPFRNGNLNLEDQVWSERPNRIRRRSFGNNNWNGFACNVWSNFRWKYFNRF